VIGGHVGHPVALNHCLQFGGRRVSDYIAIKI